MVNGGEMITLQFQRTPYKSKTVTVSVPWNQMIVISPVIMELADDNFFKGQTLAYPPGNDTTKVIHYNNRYLPKVHVIT